jgi:hypothetical protein
VLSRIDPEMAKLYEDYYGGINPFSNATDPEAYMADWRPSILTDAECMPRAQIARTEYFNDFMRPQDIQSFMILRLEAHGLEVSTITVNRAKSTRPGRSWPSSPGVPYDPDPGQQRSP